MSTPVAEAFQAYHAELVGFCAKRLGDVMVAEDIAQQVWLELLLRPDYEERGQMRGYVYQIAAHRMIDLIRVRVRRPEESLPGEWDVRHPRALFDDDAIIDRIDAALTDHINALPTRYRRVLRLRFLEDRSLDETGAALGLNKGATKALQHRAIAALRERMNPYGR